MAYLNGEKLLFAKVTYPLSHEQQTAIQNELKEYVGDEVGKQIHAIVDDDSSIPEYWRSELETKADVIQQAMETAGRNKSAFLWYTDAHYPNGNSKVSPKLLNYLYMNTPINKVNFGGDIIGDSVLDTREAMKYLYEWRKAIKDLPNHHSVLGNHDIKSNDFADDNYRYAFLLAPEETPDMVMGEGMYYYIDNPCEKTRYLYLAYLTSDQNKMIAQGKFIVNAISSVEEGWHIVVIAHRWWQYNSSSTPTAGAISLYEAEILNVFDAYNARTTVDTPNYFSMQDFTNAKGKVEFCIGGHIHVDYDFSSDGGIPIIITTADANQNRVPDTTVDSGTSGTITEAAVFGIIADYNDPDNTKITVVGVGRGTSRVVRQIAVKPISISNVSYRGNTTVGASIDTTKFTFTVNYEDGTTNAMTGVTSVSPATIGAIGSNTVTITYTEGGVTLSTNITIEGTAQEVVKPTALSNILYSGDTTVGASIDKSKFTFTVNYSNGTTNTITGATSVSPTTIQAVGNNAVVVTYTEGTSTVNGTVVIVGIAVGGGTEPQGGNLFKKNDGDIVLRGRINSSGNAVDGQPEGQLVTGYIDGKVGDTFTIKTDKSLKTNNYTCMLGCYKADKTFIGSFGLDAVSYWTWSSDNLTGTITVPSASGNKDFSTTALVRFGVAYNDIDNINITKA